LASIGRELTAITRSELAQMREKVRALATARAPGEMFFEKQPGRTG
jgi:hypothetical protein